MPRRPLSSQGQPSLYCPRRRERLGCAGAAVYRIINCHSRIFAVHGMVMEDSGVSQSQGCCYARGVQSSRSAISYAYSHELVPTYRAQSNRTAIEGHYQLVVTIHQ